MKVLSAAVSDIGNVRQVNQDAYCILTDEAKNGNRMLAAVCDGMGGLSEGDYASSSVIETITKWYRKRLPELLEMQDWCFEIKKSLNQLLQNENERLLQFGEQKQIKTGTTASIAITVNNMLILAHIGDSRIYRMMDYGMKQLSIDHSLVQEQVRKGILTKEQARKDRRRNILTRCIGVNPECEPQIDVIVLENQCSLLLCSDGFVHELEDEEIAEELGIHKQKSQRKLKKRIRTLVDEVKERGESDNITAVVVKCSDIPITEYVTFSTEAEDTQRICNEFEEEITLQLYHDNNTNPKDMQ